MRQRFGAKKQGIWSQLLRQVLKHLESSVTVVAKRYIRTMISFCSTPLGDLKTGLNCQNNSASPYEAAHSFTCVRVRTVASSKFKSGYALKFVAMTFQGVSTRISLSDLA